MKFSAIRYQICGCIGCGGTAEVFRATDRETGKMVALKRGRVDPSKRAERTYANAGTLAFEDFLENVLRREYQTLKSLAHPRIVEVYDYGIDSEGPYYTMELLEGGDLQELAPLQWKHACRLLCDIASALALLHSRRLLHRDLSPRNVRLTADGGVKLMDFGALSPMGLPKDSIGTPPFVPPEAFFRQPLDQRSDLYSLGTLAYGLLTGRHAYPAKRIQDLGNAWRKSPLPPSEVILI